MIKYIYRYVKVVLPLF